MCIPARFSCRLFLTIRIASIASSLIDSRVLEQSVRSSALKLRLHNGWHTYSRWWSPVNSNLPQLSERVYEVFPPREKERDKQLRRRKRFLLRGSGGNFFIFSSLFSSSVENRCLFCANFTYLYPDEGRRYVCICVSGFSAVLAVYTISANIYFSADF